MACATCGGAGWRVVESVAGSEAVRCDCWKAGERERRLARAGIPPGLFHCDLASFVTNDFAAAQPVRQEHPQLVVAKRVAQEFVDTYPLTGATGILFHGAAGTGKTHLMAAIVAELVLRKGARARFLDFRHLLKTIQESWNPVSESSEKEVLEEVLAADLLALDDLGAEKPSPWVRETVAYVINERYTRARPLLITTNLRYGPMPVEAESGRREMARRIGRDDRQLDHLEDRIGVPTLSRLYEMCRMVELTGVADYRHKMKAFQAEKFRSG